MFDFNFCSGFDRTWEYKIGQFGDFCFGLEIVAGLRFVVIEIVLDISQKNPFLKFFGGAGRG